MAYSVDDIVKDVLVAIDENRVAEDVLSSSTDVDTLEMDDIIKSKIADGINNVLAIAPVEKLGNCISASSQAVTRDATTSVGTIDIPDKLLRLITIKVDSWKRPVTSLTDPYMPKYLCQFSEFAGVHGHASKPVVTPSVESPEGNTTGAYNLFVVTASDSKAMVRYVASVSAPSTTVTSYNLPIVLYRACIYKIAALTMADYENVNMLQLFNSLCLEQLGIANNDKP